jgi:hypothetical protein
MLFPCLFNVLITAHLRMNNVRTCLAGYPAGHLTSSLLIKVTTFRWDD